MASGLPTRGHRCVEGAVPKREARLSLRRMLILYVTPPMGSRMGSSMSSTK